MGFSLGSLFGGKGKGGSLGSLPVLGSIKSSVQQFTGIVSGGLEMIPGVSTLKKLPVVGGVINRILGGFGSAVGQVLGGGPQRPDLPPELRWGQYLYYDYVGLFGQSVSSGYGPEGPQQPQYSYDLGVLVMQEGNGILQRSDNLPVARWNPNTGKVYQVTGFTREGVALHDGRYSELAGAALPPDIWQAGMNRVKSVVGSSKGQALAAAAASAAQLTGASGGGSLEDLIGWVTGLFRGDK